MKKIISPIIYALSIPVVSFLSVYVVNFLDINFGLHHIFWMGDLDMIVVMLFFGLVIFSAFTQLIVKFEGNNLLLISDHVRQCLFLYIFLIILLIQNIINLENLMTGGIQSALSFLISIVLLLGIIVNYIVLRKIKSKISLS